MPATPWRAILFETFSEWWQDKAPRLGAALAFYTALSLAPLLILVTPAAGALFGPDNARAQIVKQFKELFGADAARAVDLMLTANGPERPGSLATLLSVAVLLFAASGVFAELQDALDTIWDVVPKPTNKAALLSLIRQRILSFAMVLCIGFLLLVSLLMTAALSALRDFAAPHLHHVAMAWTISTHVLSFVIVTLLFAMIFKILPDVRLRWRDVWIGAALTSALFAVGRLLLGQYVGRTPMWSNYGAGKSLVILLVWVYYSAQILFLGAEFTRAYTRRSHREDAAPSSVAVPITAEAQAQQGIARSDVVQAVAQIVEKRRS